MEQAQGFRQTLANFEQAVETFQKSLELDFSRFSSVEVDTLKSGQVQKFEYCIELCWKAIKGFLFEVHGIESVSPKSSMKNFFLSNYVSEGEYETLVEMINDRNRLSHVYEASYFNEIHSKLANYSRLLQKVAVKVRQG